MRRTARLVVVLSVAYATAIVIWQALRLAFGDLWWWLAGANVLSLYLFLPLVVLLPWAWLRRRRVAIVATAVPLVFFLALYGGLLMPRLSPAKADRATPLRVMTLNVLFTNDDGAAIAQLVRAESPDLVCLQEVNPRLAVDLANRLGPEYPHYALLPEEDPVGFGVFSRYPLQEEPKIPDPAEEAGWWKHGSQVVTIEFEGQPVMVLNVHALSPAWPYPSLDWPPLFEDNFRLREKEVQAWLDRIAEYNGPVVIAGDLNVTDQNYAYRLMAARLGDAHRQAGWGFGHSAPASFEGLDEKPSPRRLLRIDYVWSSDHWEALDAWVGDWDNQSDHLPVFVDLVLRIDPDR